MDLGHLFAKSESDARFAHMIGKRFPYLFIDKVKHLSALLDEGHVYALEPQRIQRIQPQ